MPIEAPSGAAGTASQSPPKPHSWWVAFGSTGLGRHCALPTSQSHSLRCAHTGLSSGCASLRALRVGNGGKQRTDRLAWPEVQPDLLPLMNVQTSSALRHSELKLNIQAQVFRMGWCADFEFRVTYQVWLQVISHPPESSGLMNVPCRTCSSRQKAVNAPHTHPQSRVHTFHTHTTHTLHHRHTTHTTAL